MGMFDKFPYRNTRDLNLNWIIKKIIYLEGIIGAAVSDVAEFLSKKGGKMEGAIDMQNNRIFNVPTPAGDTDVTSKKYVDDKAGNYLPLAGGTMTGAVNMGGNKITSGTRCCHQKICGRSWRRCKRRLSPPCWRDYDRSR